MKPEKSRSALITAVVLVFTFQAVVAAQTRIDSITPSQGPIAGGTMVTITGSHFAGTTLTLDGTALTPTSVADAQIVFQTPRHDNGFGSIAVRGAGPAAYTEFLYLPPRLQDLPPGSITTVMGIGLFRGDGRRGPQVMYYADGGTGILFGPDGALYFSEPEFHVIRRMRNDGIVERYAGTGIGGVDDDGGIADRMSLNRPRGIAFDRASNLIFTETFVVHRIRRIDAVTRVVTTLAGGVEAGFSGDGGPAAQAQFSNPTEIATDRAGNLYVLDFGNSRIRRIGADGIVTTIAGTGTQGFSGDGGPAVNATFNVGVYDNGGQAVEFTWKPVPGGHIQRSREKDRYHDGHHHDVCCGRGHCVRRRRRQRRQGLCGLQQCPTRAAHSQVFPRSGQLEQSWGMGFGFGEDGATAESATFGLIWRIAVDSKGDVPFADAGRVRRINLQTGRLETALGVVPHIIGETGPALATVIPGADLLFLPTGELLTAESTNYFMRKMDSAGDLSVFAGNGSLTSAPLREGLPAIEVSMDPNALALAPNGDVLFIAWNAVGRIDKEGKVHALTAVGNNGFSGDGGPSSSARLLQPSDVAVDAAGNAFIADSNNNRVRRIAAATGIITTVAGIGPGNGIEGHGRGSYCGDGGPATQACLNTPLSVAVAQDGSLFVTEGSSILKFTGELIDRIRRVNPGGTITTFGTFINVRRIRFNAAGNLFMGNLRIQPSGRVFKVIGDAPASPTDIGDGGPASLAGCFGLGIAIDGEGNLFCSDGGSRRIRAIRFGAVIAEPGSTVASSDGTPQAAPARQTFSQSLTVTVRSPEGTLENGIRVDFVAPETGPSCTFPSRGTTYSTLTDINGRASASCAANSQIGSYVVTATPLALSQSAHFVLTNTASPPRRRAVGPVPFRGPA